MKRLFTIAIGILLLGGLAVAQYTPGPKGGSTGPPPPEKQKGPQLRSVNGRVTGGDAPLKDAIVYIKNTRTLAVKTYIADDAGRYQFNALLPSVDYEIFAESKGRKSDTKTLSSFDSRKDVTINLHIDK